MSNLEEYILKETGAATDWYQVGAGGLPVMIISSGEWDGKITLQIWPEGCDCEKDYGSTSYNKNFVFNQRLPNDSKIRAIFLNDDYVSGEATISITQ